MVSKLESVPDKLNEEYYQINPDILGSFSKYRPAVNLFKFHEDIATIRTYYKVGERLSNEQVEEVRELVKEGMIFVSRADHPVYVKHIAFQLDLVLVDKNLKESEIADIFVQALTMRLEEFFEQPVRAAYERLHEDIMVFTEYLYADVHRIKALTRRLHTNHTLTNHSFNCGVMGTLLFTRLFADEFRDGSLKRKTFDNMVVGQFLHDLGMSKVPAFVRQKAQNLSVDEQNKILSHPKTGYEMLHKLDVRADEVERAVMEHHERMDGSGYPMKLKGRELSVIGKLSAVVDSYCAMTTLRPYADAMAPDKAVALLARDDAKYAANMTRVLQSFVLTGT